MISMIDDCIGRVRSANGAADAIQIFTTDHGDHLGDHKLLFKGAEQYEQITHVPMIWSDPADRASKRTDAIGQTHDLGTTILDRANVEPAIGMQGISLLTESRDFAFIQYDHKRQTPGWALGQEFTRYATHAGEFQCLITLIGANSTISKTIRASWQTFGTALIMPTCERS